MKQAQSTRDIGPAAFRFGGFMTGKAVYPGYLLFREIFSETMHFGALRNVTFVFLDFALPVNMNDSRLSMAA